MKKYLSILVLVLCVFQADAAIASEKALHPGFAVHRAQIDQALKGVNDRLTRSRAVPYFENGKPAGYKVVRSRSGSVYQKLGLKNGDVIRQVNGKRIDNPQKAFEMMESPKHPVQLKIARKGTERVVDLKPESKKSLNEKSHAQ